MPVSSCRSPVGASERVYAIGDIHGRYDLLLALLAEIYRDANSRADQRLTQLVFLGDYIDRGDESARVLAALQDLELDTEGRVTFLRGNHEEALLGFLKDPIKHKNWLDFGAQQTLASYGIDHATASSSLNRLVATRDALRFAMGSAVDFLRRMPTHLTLGNTIFTHAGGNPVNGVITSDERAMVWGHRSGLVDEPLAGQLLVHGHFDASDPVNRPGRICVDTGAYHSGCLTAVRIDESIEFLHCGRGA